MIETSDPREQGVSLVGTLLVLVILGGLAAFTVSSLPSGDTRALLGGSGSNGSAGGSSAGLPGATRPPSLTETAGIAACRADEQTIQAAVAANYAGNGRYTSTVGELVTAHWLSQAPVAYGYQFSLEVVDGKPTGHVLVNGVPGIAGCDRPLAQ